jgi:recombination protein RecA
VEFDVLYGEVISREGELLDMAVDVDIVNKSGAWYSYNGERIGQGRENCKQFLIENPDIYNSIEAKLLAHFNVRRIGVEVGAPAAGGAPAAPAAAAPAAPEGDAPDDKGKGTNRRSKTGPRDRANA